MARQFCFLNLYCPRQEWSLPDSIIYYIIKNPTTPNCYQKLIQSCKYFFIKNPIIVIETMYFDYEEWVAYSKQLDKHMGLNNVSSKFWITDIFDAPLSGVPPSNVVSSIIPQIYCINAKKICFCDQIISFKEFLFLSSNVVSIKFHQTTVKNEDDSTVLLEKLVAVLPKIKTFKLFDSSISSSITKDTVKELINISHFLKIDKFKLNNISEIFDIEIFYDYIKKKKHMRFYLGLCDFISDAYKNGVESIIDEILSTENHEYGFPFIYFNGLPQSKSKKLALLYTQHKNFMLS